MSDILVKHSEPKVEILIHRGGAVEFHSFSREEAKEIQVQLNRLLPEEPVEKFEFRIGTAVAAEGEMEIPKKYRRNAA